MERGRKDSYKGMEDKEKEGKKRGKGREGEGGGKKRREGLRSECTALQIWERGGRAERVGPVGSARFLPGSIMDIFPPAQSWEGEVQVRWQRRRGGKSSGLHSCCLAGSGTVERAPAEREECREVLGLDLQETRNMSGTSRERRPCHIVYCKPKGSRHTMWQWKSRVPGISVITLTTLHVPGATVIVSRRRGFVKLCWSRDASLRVGVAESAQVGRAWL